MFLKAVDERTGKARRYKDIVSDLTSDLGGDLSAAKTASHRALGKGLYSLPLRLAA